MINAPSLPPLTRVIVFLFWLSPAVIWTLFALALGGWLFLPRARHAFYFKILIALTAGYRVLYAALGSFGQHRIWAGDPVARQIFLNGSYFWGYIWGRFWLNVSVSFLFALLFWIFLHRLARYRARFFEAGEVELGVLAALLVGWPVQPVFLIAVFVSVILISVFRMIAFKETYTTLGGAFLLALFLCLVFGLLLLHSAGWDYLKI